MGEKDNSFDFNKKFTTYLSKNIKLSDLITEKETKNTKFSDKLGSIFKNFDNINQDNQLDAKEINQIINEFDIDKDKKITEDEIKNYCEKNGLDKKITKTFIEKLYNSFSSAEPIETSTHGYKQKTYMQHRIDSTQYGNDYIKYDTISQKGDIVSNDSAIYDIKNDTLRPTNVNQPIEITGIKAFQNATIKNGKFEQPAEDFDSYPKIIITGTDGKKTELEIRINNVNLSSMNDEKDYMLLMTSLTSALSQLKPNVLEDLANNVNHISFGKVAHQNAAGMATNNEGTIDNYEEAIILDIQESLVCNVTLLTHEIGHTVDNNITGHVTEKHKKQLDNFIKNIISSDAPINTKYAYALTDPQELFAEYYAYKAGGAQQKASDELFKFLETSLNNGDKYGWSAIKETLDGIKNESIKSQEQHIRNAKEAEIYFAEENKKEGAIPEDRIKNIDSNTLWEAFNSNNTRPIFEKILENYAEYSNRFRLGTNTEKLEIVTIMRNHPDFKATLEECLNVIDTQKAEKEKLNNLPFNEALTVIETNLNAKQSQPIKKDHLLKNIEKKGIKELENLLNSQELRNIVIQICKDNKDIPKSISDKFKEGSNEPITEDVLLALRNEPNMWSFLIFDKEYFRSKQL